MECARTGLKMRIAICDDDAIIRDMVVRLLRQYCQKHNFVMESVTFSSGEELLSYSFDFDIIFLDIVMKGMDGIETANILRRRENKAKVILLTSHYERFKEGYKVQAYRFMTKPVCMEELEEYMEDARNEITRDKVLTFKKDGLEINLSMYKILYISAQFGYTEVWTEKDMFRSKNSLAMWEEILDGRVFFRCHKKYIVNLNFVSDIRSFINMQNGERLQVSRRKYMELKKRLMDLELSK